MRIRKSLILYFTGLLVVRTSWASAGMGVGGRYRFFCLKDVQSTVSFSKVTISSLRALKHTHTHISIYYIIHTKITVCFTDLFNRVATFSLYPIHPLIFSVFLVIPHSQPYAIQDRNENFRSLKNVLNRKIWSNSSQKLTN